MWPGAEDETGTHLWRYYICTGHVAMACGTVSSGTSFTESYKCGGTIINSVTILTAFHCVAVDERPIAADRIIIRAGLFDLEMDSSTRQENKVFNIIFPPKASAKTLNNDIAILKMKFQFSYGDYVQPICIRSALQDIEKLEGVFGTIVGWGYTNQTTRSAQLLEAYIPVVSAKDCLKSDRTFYQQVLKTKVYCAGSRNGTSSCKGDSGGGMFFQIGGYWFLRGLTSFFKRDENSLVCTSKEYIVYTDVARYLDWIRDQDVEFDDPLENTPIANDVPANYSNMLLPLSIDPEKEEFLQQHTSNVSTPIIEPVPSDDNPTLLRLTVDPKTKKFLQQHKGKLLLRVKLNGRKAESLFQ
uniref:Peptidase S1 domain-containing protein n=1 Tax=Anopheles funestus TaxID=62324 RepID=A0A4Y0BEL5_ANOFN